MRTSDLLPRASGLANIGLDSDEYFSVFAIVPYGHIHLNSGIFHDPLYGQSGVLRFSEAANEFQIAEDGGINFSGVTLTNTRDLQDLYDSGDTDVTLTSGEGDLLLQADDRKLVIAAVGSLAPLRITPQDSDPSSNRDVGDLWMIDTDEAEQGIAHLFYDSGSGVIPVMPASGFLHPRSASNQLVPKTGNLHLDVDFDSVYQAGDIGRDLYYGYDPSSAPEQIRVLADGLYEVTLNIAFDRSGNARQIGSARMLVNSTEVKSQSYCYNRNTAAGEGTCYSRFLVFLQAGDLITVEGGTHTNVDLLNTDTLSTHGNIAGTTDVRVRGGVFMTMKRIGPRRD